MKVRVQYRKNQPLTLPASYVADFSLSADGRLATYSSISTARNVPGYLSMRASGSMNGPVQPITSGTNDFEYIDLANVFWRKAEIEFARAASVAARS